MSKTHPHKSARKKHSLATIPDTSIVEAYRTPRGVMYQGSVESFLASPEYHSYRGKVQLIFTSPPFPLNRKKKYGNLQGEAYVHWLAGLAPALCELLKPDGSIVLEVGNAWEPRKPVMSTLALRSLIAFLDAGGLNLCQQFVVHNPARLPGPAQWVNIERIRVKDSFTFVWWMSKSERPKADNRRVLNPYSPSMLRLLKTKNYNAGARPSEHHIGAKSFLKDNKGSIPSNVLTFSNTASADDYLKYCRANKIKPHPARMPIALPEFFIKLLTSPKNLVLDPFGGSNTTGAAAEYLKRRWISIEPNESYIEASKGRFLSKDRKKS